MEAEASPLRRLWDRLSHDSRKTAVPCQPPTNTRVKPHEVNKNKVETDSNTGKNKEETTRLECRRSKRVKPNPNPENGTNRDASPIPPSKSHHPPKKRKQPAPDEDYNPDEEPEHEDEKGKSTRTQKKPNAGNTPAVEWVPTQVESKLLDGINELEVQLRDKKINSKADIQGHADATIAQTIYSVSKRELDSIKEVLNKPPNKETSVTKKRGALVARGKIMLEVIKTTLMITGASAPSLLSLTHTPTLSHTCTFLYRHHTHSMLPTGTWVEQTATPMPISRELIMCFLALTLKPSRARDLAGDTDLR